MVNSGEAASKTVIEEVRSVLTTGTATSYAGLTCGPNAQSSEAIIVVEGRNDVRNLDLASKMQSVVMELATLNLN